MPDAGQVREMFGEIAGRYDALNRILSLGSDRSWRSRTCDILAVRQGERAADLCCGTGDLALDLARRGARVVAADFSRPMLDRALDKGAAGLVEADALALPFAEGSFDLVTMAFGFRNLADRERGLSEIRRVLRPGGRLGILEFAMPRSAIFRRIYLPYLRRMVPAVGAIISGRRGAYHYLASSIQAFPEQSQMTQSLGRAGFDRARHHDFFFGIAALYVAHRPS